MSFHKSIIDKIRQKGGNFFIELTANQSSLRYGLRIKSRLLLRQIFTRKDHTWNIAEVKRESVVYSGGKSSLLIRKKGIAD